MKLRTLRTESPFDEVRGAIRAGTSTDLDVRDATAAILNGVASRGDAALLEFTARFDDVRCSSVAELMVTPAEMERAADQLDPSLFESLCRAAANIRSFHEKQLENGFLDLHPDGTLLGQRVLPLARVGVYVPGGRAAYPSSVLMNVVPARVAGVDRVVMVCPTPGGAIEPAVLAAAHIAGVDELYRIGGAQAVAALAYGTETIEPVDKVVGPGNRWVAEAKRQVFGVVDIDMVAGPSEILVVADDSANPRFIAADLIGQAEHDPDAISWLVTTEEAFEQSVASELGEMLSRNPRREIATESLTRNGLMVIVPDLDAAAAVANIRAAEHVELLVRDPVALAGRIRNAGAIFLGHNSAEPLGDYFAGPNHVLPTGGTARWASPLGTYEFLKRTSIIGYSRQRLLDHAEDVIRLAESEHLFGHAEAIRVRVASRGGE